jgi:hypothetical protein
LIQKLEDFFQSEIARRMQESLNLLQKSVKEKQEVVQTLEQKLLVVLSNTLGKSTCAFLHFIDAFW